MTPPVRGYVGGGIPKLTAGLAGDIFLAKYDPNGAHLWSQSFGPGGWDEGRGVVCDASGNVYVGGRFEQTVNFGGGPRTGYNLFVAKYDPNGNYMIDRDYGGQYLDTCYDIALDNNGNILLTGFFRGTVDFGGGPVTATGNGDIYVLKLDPSFSHVWSRGMGGTDTGRISLGHRVAADAAGNAIVTGYFNTTVDFGGGPLTAIGSEDIFLAKYNAYGTHVWSRQFGGNYGRGYGVAVDAAGDVVMTGAFAGTTDFGGGPLYPLGNDDIVLAKYEGHEQTVSVAIKGFDATVLGGAVRLRGEFRSDLGVQSVNVYRGSDTSAFRQIESLAGNRSEFVFVDYDVTSGATYRYRIGVVDADGEFLSPVVTVSVDAVATALAQNRPNPFNPVTAIPYSLAEEGAVSLHIYDAAGRLVRHLVSGVQTAGPHTANWDGRDDRGITVASGVYFCRLRAGMMTETRRMVLLK